jgi:hypothetical protein
MLKLVAHSSGMTLRFEKLLPYNIDPELLNNMRSIPELVMPQKVGLIKRLPLSRARSLTNPLIRPEGIFANLHIYIIRSPTTLRGCPEDVLLGIFDVACFAMDTILRINL